MLLEIVLMPLTFVDHRLNERIKLLISELTCKKLRNHYFNNKGKAEKFTILLKSIGEVRSRGKRPLQKLEGQMGRHRSSQLTREEIHKHLCRN